MTPLYILNICPSTCFALEPADVESVSIGVDAYNNDESTAAKVTITLKSGRVLTSDELATSDTPAELLFKIVMALDQAEDDGLPSTTDYLATPCPK